MFRDFFELREELVAKGEKFTTTTLQQLAYSDLHRAAIGDAGRAACDLETVELERNIRLNDAEFMSPEEVRSAGMAEDLALRRTISKAAALPTWESLSPTAQAYLRIRCLRAHADQPLPRLATLQTLLERLFDQEETVGGALVITRMLGAAYTLHTREAQTPPLTVQQIREAFRGCDAMLRDLNDWERAICMNRTVTGYTCTSGCFAPVSLSPE